MLKGHILVTARVPGLIRHPLLEVGYASTAKSDAEDVLWPAPLIGPLATGHEGAGIGLAPITGRLITDWIAGADLPPVAAQVCRDRFDYQLSEG